MAIYPARRFDDSLADVHPDLAHPKAALVLPPRANLVTYHGLLAPNHPWRRRVVPSGTDDVAAFLSLPRRRTVGDEKESAATTTAERRGPSL